MEHLFVVLQEYSDDRLKRSSEMFMGIKLLKLYGWEDSFRNMIEAIRIKELNSILWFNMQFGNTGKYSRASLI